MGTVEPNDMDAIFNEIVADLELDTNTEGVVNYAELPTRELMDEYHRLKGELQERQELIHPTTPEGRELLAQFSAVKVIFMERRSSSESE